jgi:hypothetical protein
MQISKQVAKFMALEKLEKTQLIKIKVEKNKIHWVEKEYELRINSELFDVKSYTTLSNGDIICMGLFDSAEDEVIESTAKIFDHKNSATTHSLVIKICSLVFDKQHNSMLKIDIEFNEWEVLEEISLEVLNGFSQILIELHFVPVIYNGKHSPYFTEFFKNSYVVKEKPTKFIKLNGATL